MSEERKQKYGVDGDTEELKVKNESKGGYVKNVLIVEEKIDSEKEPIKTSYINSITSNSQGIGSRCWIYRSFKWNI